MSTHPSVPYTGQNRSDASASGGNSRILEIFDDGGERIAVADPGPRLDALEAQNLRPLIDTLLSDGLTHLVVDLSRTEFVDSAGLACLVRAMMSLRRHGGDIAIVRPESDETWRVFRLTQFDEVFPIIPAFRR